ncbi:hypothetical protein A8C75_02490 [Marinobacterium aestuarii]|uniref:Uncharacterized protein n=1 Tax=Marinobacterium aestuarii TaxID=1821621 RepID=A0A1A9EV54_9GAMM|nr:hypothetical protein [Marinobacterium aestuarii]ANG61449.1 hypothetical protein A8C75_02490 [Marinobacterium aestuarii]
MRKLFRLLGFLLIPALIAGGAYGYYWYQVKSSADRMVDAAAPYAKISYARVVAGLDGSAGIAGVQVTPVGSKDSVLIGSVLFQAPDPLFYLDAEKTLREGSWPEHMALSITGLDMNLDADYLAQWEAMGQSFAVPQQGTGFEALACGDVQRFDLATTRAMKYQRLNMDMLVAMDFMPRTQSLRLRSDVSVADMAQTSFYVDLSLASNVLSIGSLVQAQPTLERVSLDYSDLGYNARRNRFCAQRGGYAPDEYAQRHSEMVHSELKQLGWSVPELLLKAYADLQQPRAILQVAAEPPPGFGAQSMATISSPEDLLDLLNIRVSVNGVSQDLSSINWSLDPGEAVAANAAAEVLSSDALQSENLTAGVVEKRAPQEDLVIELEQPRPEPGQVAVIIDPDVVQVMPGIVVKAKAAEKTYKPTAVQQVHGYAGQKVKLRTYFGRRIEGTLVRVAGGNLEVEQRLDRGVAIFPIAADKVAELSVWR